MPAVDTNVVIRIIQDDDESQRRKAIKTLTEENGWISLLVLLEVTWVLGTLYDYEHTKIQTAIKRLLQSDLFVVENPIAAGRALARYEEKPSLGFADCLILEYAVSHNKQPLLTFDRDLAKSDGAKQL